MDQEIENVNQLSEYLKYAVIGGNKTEYWHDY